MPLRMRPKVLMSEATQLSNSSQKTTGMEFHMTVEENSSHSRNGLKKTPQPSKKEVLNTMNSEENSLLIVNKLIIIIWFTYYNKGVFINIKK